MTTTIHIHEPSTPDDFLRDLGNESNFRILLALALERTQHSPHPLLELGPSEHSTAQLHALCEALGRPLLTIEEDILKAARWRHLETPRHEIKCCDWSSAPLESGTYSVALIKHSPGERRWADMMRLLGRCEIIVCHNSEPAADHGYQYSKVWPSFRSRVDVKTEGAWATAVSNVHDLSAWRGFRVGRYVVSNFDEDVRADPVAEAVERFLTEPTTEEP